MSPLITPELVALDVEVADRHAAARLLGEKLAAQGRVTDLEGFLDDVRKRDEQAPTGIPGGIGIPHCRSEHVTEPTLGFARVPSGVDFGAEDGDATLVFLIAAPAGGGSDHMKILAALARRLVRASFKDGLRQASSAQEVADLVNTEVTV